MPPLPALRLLRRPASGAFAFAALIFIVAVARFYNGVLPSYISSSRWHYSKISEFYRDPRDGSRYYKFKTPSFFPPSNDSRLSKVDPCAGFPVQLLNSIQIVLKTGTGEPAKTKAHLDTVTSCIPNLLIFSDNEELINGHHVIDILADLPGSFQNIPDFAAYSSQKQAYASGKAVGYSPEDWKLDRFKFLPMVEKAHEMRPDADWYVFIESDVYYFWDTLFRLLSQLDPSKMHYMGSPAPGADGTFFAYGGAGFVLSAGLMERLTEDHVPLSVRYEEHVQTGCCGDAILGQAILNKTGERLQALYPTFAGDELDGLKIDQERWCIPLLSLHRVSPEQMSSLWEWERNRAYDQDPFTHSTIADYISPGIFEAPVRTAWDNYAGDVQPEDSPAHASAAACAQTCESERSCLQYQYSDGICKFGTFYQKGRQRDGAAITSGWDTKKMVVMGHRADVKKSSSCSEPTWLRPEVR
ncbi:hypothetical protein PFICI_14522 [Pestalotiopsis fici W106-1]|uniref:Apple domain-containing protein n=1 Tax=Pestalotiopsis fici (strain W106-1 / CGMCC3.15140) TaxID=1229662 RepID=W3WL86_PESFW|nr:uncharacterized protein PFICI_14522 [Pestalotiopsis fici W106-1]ETS73576.1 hypothetical protein PFICI_14522 [Pestalotiopsis fici W106-1]